MAVVRFLPHLNPATLPLTLHPGPTTMRPHLRVRLIPSAMADQGRAYEHHTYLSISNGSRSAPPSSSKTVFGEAATLVSHRSSSHTGRSSAVCHPYSTRLAPLFSGGWQAMP
jgi:hypothetical protein